MKYINVSFDFDGTLYTDKKVQQLLNELTKMHGVKCWIHTRRYNNEIESM